MKRLEVDTGRNCSSGLSGGTKDIVRAWRSFNDLTGEQQNKVKKIIDKLSGPIS